MEPGDILFSHINSLKHIGKTAYYDGEHPLYHGMNLLLLRTTNEESARFLFYQLNTSRFLHRCQVLANQAVNQASINTRELKGITLHKNNIKQTTTMTRKQAAEIARRYYTFNTGEMPNEVRISIYNMEDGIAKCTIPATHRGDEVIYEVELNTIANTIVMKRIENESPLADFLRTETRLSTLNKGDKFRLEGDCVVYSYFGKGERFGNIKYGFLRVDNNQLCWLSDDVNVYPL